MKYILPIFAALLLVSCSVKKRAYRHGYYVDWAVQKKQRSGTDIKNSATASKRHEPVEIVTVKPTAELEASILTSSQKKISLIDTCGDVITFKSGDQVTVKVTEITDDKIKYRRCDNLDGPVFVVNKSTVALIRYANGVEEKITAPVQINNTAKDPNVYGNDKYQEPQKIHPLAWWSLVSLAFGFFLGFGIVGALILSIYAIKEISRNPKKWKGLTLAKVVKTISVICLILIGVIIILYLGSL
jgi:hypothetical protein